GVVLGDEQSRSRGVERHAQRISVEFDPLDQLAVSGRTDVNDNDLAVTIRRDVRCGVSFHNDGERERTADTAGLALIIGEKGPPARRAGVPLCRGKKARGVGRAAGGGGVVYHDVGGFFVVCTALLCFAPGGGGGPAGFGVGARAAAGVFVPGGGGGGGRPEPAA